MSNSDRLKAFLVRNELKKEQLMQQCTNSMALDSTTKSDNSIVSRQNKTAPAASGDMKDISTITSMDSSRLSLRDRSNSGESYVTLRPDRKNDSSNCSEQTPARPALGVKGLPPSGSTSQLKKSNLSLQRPSRLPTKNQVPNNMPPPVSTYTPSAARLNVSDAGSVKIRSKSASNIENVHIDENCAPGTASRLSRSISTRSLYETFVVNGHEYQTLKLLGKGGSSKVYECLSESSEVVALKVVDLDEEMTRTAFLNEVELLERLQHCKGREKVIRLHEFEDAVDTLYIVLEKGDVDLSTLLKGRRKTEEMDVTFVRYHWKEMLECVKAIHDEKILHSDLKPANFLMVRGHLKLIDFGIASAIPSNKTSVVKDTPLGTLSYMSPEMLEEGLNGRYSLPLKSDVWSLGCILYLMVYGRLPFASFNNQRLKMEAICNPACEIDFPECGDELLRDVMIKSEQSIQTSLISDPDKKVSPRPEATRLEQSFLGIFVKQDETFCYYDENRQNTLQSLKNADKEQLWAELVVMSPGRVRVICDMLKSSKISKNSMEDNTVKKLEF